MKLMILDPSGTTNYCNGLADTLCEFVDLTVIVRDNYIAQNEGNYRVKRWFKLKGSSNKNKIKKGIKYIVGYIRTICEIVKGHYDVIHIQWFLKYPIDLFFLKIMKKYCPCIVYTAHNILPHIRENDIKIQSQLLKIYNIVDKIVVHGQASKNELLMLFPQIPQEKIYIQWHGVNPFKEDNIKKVCRNQNIIKKIQNHNGKKMLYLGVIFKNKGVERLFKFWLQFSKMYPNELMIIAGKVIEHTKQYDYLSKQFENLENGLYLPEQISDELHDYLYQKSDIIILPYEHASMSGVIFDAAKFSKTILTTKVGCIPEYLERGIDSIITDNSEVAIQENLIYVIENYNDEQLRMIGSTLKNNIYKKYSWTVIAHLLIERIYSSGE